MRADNTRTDTKVMDRFRESTVSATFSNPALCGDLHTLDFILPRTFVFEMHVFMGVPRIMAPDFGWNPDGNFIMEPDLGVSAVNEYLRPWKTFLYPVSFLQPALSPKDSISDL